MVKVVFILGKTRSSPIKALSIPRLELEAAVLGVLVKDAIINGHEIKPKKTVLWSDSKTAIHWVRSDTRAYKQFVAHRISEILDFSEVDDWRWVPGRQNPADYATRPQEATWVTANSPWIKGPSILARPEEEWPRLPKDIAAHEKSDEKRSNSIFTISHITYLLAPEKYSSYYKLLKVICWLQRAFIKCKYLIKKATNLDLTSTKRQPSVAEISAAESLLCRLVQKEAFPMEVKILLLNKIVPKNSSIYKLSPILDEDNLIRLGGRIDNAECLPFAAKRPIIMPKCHSVTKLLVRYYHEHFRHQNQEAIICAIRAKYWIPNLRRLVRTTKLSCQVCKNASAMPVPPIMGQLPVDRLTPYVRPFSYTGVDYFGPLQVSIGRRREKRWAAIFTCLGTRAIHLELAKDLSTDAVIICLRNFINRRGVPVRIRSDCGTNFVGANKEQWLATEKTLQNECTRRGIEWVFNVPGNPSSGGVWERMVRCVKRVLSFTLKERAPQLETLQGLLIEAENLVNSRPLTHLPVESADAEPLTPNHFLLGCPNYVQTPAVNENICLRKQWHILQQLKQTFWKRWVLEYLPTLTRRTKWHNPTSPMKVGDIVLVCDDNESRGEWKRGRIIEVFPAPDGQVRSAVVQTLSGNLRRPVSKLAKLDLMSSESPM